MHRTKLFATFASLVPAALAALALAGSASAAPVAPAPDGQEQPATDVLCRNCGNHGEKDCARHKGLLEIERAVLLCSDAAACSRCEGALSIDCKLCTNPPVERDAEKRRELAKAWLAERRATIDVHTRGKDIRHVKTENLDLTFGLRAMTVGKARVDEHRLMHLYADRIEDLRRRFVETFELTERDFPREAGDASPRLKVFMFDDPEDQREVSPRVTGIGGSGVGAKLMGASLAYCMLHDKRSLPDDEAVHRSVVHSVSHLLLSSMVPTVWIGNRKHGWVDEGVAHYFEYQVDGRCTNFCYEEVGLVPGAGFKNGRWRSAMRKLVESGKLRKFTELYEKNSDQLDFVDHAHAFAWVEFLIARGGGRLFADFLRKIKAGAASRDAMREVWSLTPLTFDEQFSAWVVATYPMQEGDR